jgi:ribosome recycling factor
MIDEVMKELQESLDKAIAALRRELSKVRTGRAHPSILDRIRVDYYGVPTPISQLATVAVPDARLLTVRPWERTQVKAVEKAIRESDLGLNPQVDAELIRIPHPGADRGATQGDGQAHQAPWRRRQGSHPQAPP